MSGDASPPHVRRGRYRRWRVAAAIGVGAATAGALAWALGPGAPALVSGIAEGRPIWRLGTLHVEGVTARGLGHVRAQKLTLSDERGVWAELRGVRVDWSPLALIVNRVDIQSIDATEIDILRNPKLGPERPPGFLHPEAHIDAMRAARIDVAEAVAGRPARLSFSGLLDMEDGDLSRMALDFASVGEKADSLAIRFKMAPGEMARVVLRGAAGGLFANALGTGAEAVRLDARANGDETTGSASLDATIGEATLTRGRADWSPRATNGSLTLDATASKAFVDIGRRVGPRLAVDARTEGNRSGAQDFQFTLAADNLDVRMQGRLSDDWKVEGPVRGRVSTANVRRLFPWLSILERGGVAVAGEWNFENAGKWKLVGRGDVTQVGIAGTHVSGEGPLAIDWSPRTVEVSPNLALRVDADPMTERLLRNARLAARISYDRGASRLDVRAASLDGDAMRLDATGDVGDETGALSGNWRVMRLAAAHDQIGGVASGAWRVQHPKDARWRLSVEGAAAGFSSRTALVAQMFGRSPRASLQSEFAPEGMRIARIAVEGPKLRAGATGLWAEELDMRWEATARGPLRLGAAEVNGAADATGTLTGARDRPRLQAQARMQRFDLAGAPIERPTLDIVYDFSARAGQASAVGTFWGEPAHARAALIGRDDALVLDNLSGDALGFDARGSAAFADIGPSLDLTFSGPLSHFMRDSTGAITGTARMMPVSGAPPRLALNAETRQSQFHEMRIAHATFSLNGPLGDLAAQGEMRGMSGNSPLSLDMRGAVRSEDDLTVATIDTQGRVNGATLATRTPARFAFGKDGLDAQASLTAGAGAADFTWHGDARRFAATARFDRAELAPLASVVGRRAEGTLSGEVSLASAGEALTGQTHLSIDRARLPARMRSPLDVRVDGRLEPSRITGSLVARSGDGLDARIEGYAPVETRAHPVRIALAAGGEGRAEWRASGPADALFSLIGGLDQNLGGDVSGAGRIRFTATTLSGAGDLSLANGSFEDKRSGVRLRDVAARMEFFETGASRFTLAARDEAGGRLTGEGSARGARDGRMDLRLRALSIIDNEDMEAVATGDIAFEWTRAGAKLSGGLRLDRAQLTLATRAEAVVPVIDVVEINRPVDEAPRERRRPAGAVADLDLTLNAPGRVYTRGRGLDAEWSLDARLRGTSAAPLLYGEARLVRGEFNLAGQRFDLNRGTIRLAGNVEDAVIDLLAERESSDLTARIAVTGDLTDPEITLSSDPALPEDEILPQILFGRSAEELSPLEGAQLAASLGALTGSAAFDIAGMARAAIGLDRLDVREDSAGLVVTGGRYLTRDVYLELSRSGLGEPGTRVEWRVRPRLSLVTSFLANGDQRASVRWRRDY